MNNNDDLTVFQGFFPKKTLENYHKTPLRILETSKKQRKKHEKVKKTHTLWIEGSYEESQEGEIDPSGGRSVAQSLQVQHRATKVFLLFALPYL